AELPDAAFLSAELACALGILRAVDGECRAGVLPASWREGLLPTVASLWTALLGTSFVDSSSDRGGAMASAALLSLLYLGQLSENAWAKLRDLDEWISTNHPFWIIPNPKSEIRNPKRKTQDANGAPQASDFGVLPFSHFLLSVVYQLRILQIGKDENGEWLVRLSPIGPWLLRVGTLAAPPGVSSRTPVGRANFGDV